MMAARAAIVLPVLLGMLAQAKPGYAAGPVALEAELAGMHQRFDTCPVAAQDGAAPSGWRALPAQCAWSGRLQARHWEMPLATGAACVSPEARWWAWEQQRLGGASAWRAGSAVRTLALSGTGQRSLAIIARTPDGWEAIEWRWTPAASEDTRKWEQAEWHALTALVAAREDTRMPVRTRDPVEAAWLRQLNGRPGEIGPAGWQWEANGLCLRMLPSVPPEAGLRLPYHREDARLEQRSAMQIQLARRFPDAVWLRPFGLVDVPGADGASYRAVWTDKTNVIGQLWQPGQDGQAMLRLRIVTPLRTRDDSAAGHAAAEAAGAVVARELDGMAHTLGAGHGN